MTAVVLFLRLAFSWTDAPNDRPPLGGLFSPTDPLWGPAAALMARLLRLLDPGVSDSTAVSALALTVFGAAAGAAYGCVTAPAAWSVCREPTVSPSAAR